MPRPAKLYTKHKNTVHHIAWSFHRTTGHPVDELVSVGNEAFMTAARTFNHKKDCSFNTWLIKVIRNKLITFTKKNKLPQEKYDEIQNMVNKRPEFDPVSMCHFKLLVEDLSTDAQAIVKGLFTAPVEAFGVIGTESAKIVRGAIRRSLRKKGWRHTQIWDAIHELKSLCQQLSIGE